MNLLDLMVRIGVDDQASGKLSTFAAKTGQVIGTAAKAGAAAMTAFTAASVKTGMDFDKAMSQVAATMGKSMSEMQDEVGAVDLSWGTFSGNLREYAQEMGAHTAFSATQAAEALNYMALAGYDTQTSMEMLPNVLNLAAAGNMDLARASDMVTDTQTAFGISLERTSQMVDEMAKASSTGNTSVQQLGEAFLVVGGLAKELNGGYVTLKDGTQVATDGVQDLEIALTAMANAGIKGSEAGTHMRNMLLKIATPTADGTKRLEEMGVAVFDTEGRMRSLKDIFGDLNTAMSTMTQEEKIQAISELFNARDMASAEAMLAAISQDWDTIGESILNADGAAEKMAATQLDNLAGDVTLFKSAFEALQIAISDKVSPALRSFVQAASEGVSRLTEAINQFDLGGFIQQLRESETVAKVFAVIVSGGIGIAIAQLAGPIGAAIGFFRGFAAEILILASRFAPVNGGLIGVAKWLLALAGPVGIAMAAIGALAAGFAYMTITNEDFRARVIETASRIGEAFAPAVDAIGAAFSQLADTAIPALTGAFESIAPVLGEVGLVLMNIAAVASEVISAVVANVVPILADIVGMLIEFAGAIVEAVMPVIKGILEQVNTAMPMIQQVVSSVMDAIFAVIQFVWPAIQATIQTTLSVISGIITAVMAVINGDWSGAWDAISGVAATVWSMISSTVQGAISAISAAISAVLSTISGIWSGGWEGVKSTVSSAWNSVKSTVQSGVSSVVSFIQGLPGRIAGIFSGAGSLLVGAGQRIMDGLLSGIRSGIDQVKGLLNSVTGLIPDWKGPEDVDRNLLYGSGQLIMGGLVRGIDSERDTLRRALGGVTDDISGWQFGGQWSASPALQGASSGAFGSVTNIYIDGAVVNASEDVKAMFYDGFQELKRKGLM